MVAKDTNDNASTASWVNPARVTLSTTAEGATVSPVLVGVIDGDFDTTHAEIKDQIKSHMEFGATKPVNTTDTTSHGTKVAQVIAGRQVGASGNIALLLGSTEDSLGINKFSAINKAGESLFRQGARVVNMSMSSDSGGGMLPIFDLYSAALRGKGAFVVSAGNEDANLTRRLTNSLTIYAFGMEPYKQITLTVGALSDNLLKRSYSNYPGQNAAIQERFMVEVDSSYVQPSASAINTPLAELTNVRGTSYSAPKVTAAAATLFGNWPHLSGAQVTALLLKSADRTFTTAYRDNTCGSAGENINCGLYYFGQGKLDLASAMKPVGSVLLPASASVSGPSNSVASTSLQLPAAFGNSLQGQQIDAVAFDSYGRDYPLNLLSMVASQASRLDIGAWDKPEPLTRQSGELDMRLQMQSNHTVSQLAMNYTGSAASLSLNHGLSSEAKAANYGLGLARAGGGLMNASGTQAMTTAMGLSVDTGKTTSVQLRTEAGTAYSASRHEAAFTVKPAAGTSMTVGQSVSAEKALLGAAGNGGLALDRSTGSGTFVRLSQDMGLGWTVFGHAEIGTLAVQGHNALSAIRDVQTSQFGLGLTQRSDRESFGLAVSQPLRADRAQADFRVATGRTLAGEVNYTTTSLSLAPAGRQLDLDMSYQRFLSSRSSLGVQATYSQDADHVVGAKLFGVAAKYRLAF